RLNCIDILKQYWQHQLCDTNTIMNDINTSSNENDVLEEAQPQPTPEDTPKMKKSKSKVDRQLIDIYLMRQKFRLRMRPRRLVNEF
ncbi:hypothetical protein GWI33_003920, partial [Rhynchophorus ferrugineus]